MDETVQTDNVEVSNEGSNGSEGSETITIDYSESLEAIANNQEILIEKLDDLLGYFDVISSAGSSIITYSVYYVPLIILVMMLWWFFKQFIR